MEDAITYKEEIKRKLIHLSSLWMVCAILLIPCKFYTGILFGILFILTVLVERAYVLKMPVVKPLYDFFFGKMLRKEPSPDAWIVSGGAPVYAAAALSCFCFSRLCAGMGMAVLLTADVAAALIGRRFGKHKFSNGKSWEGTLSFFIVGMLAVLVCAWFSGRISLTLYAFPAVFCGTLAELFQKTLRLDDNFLIPVLTAGILQFTLFLAGIPC